MKDIIMVGSGGCMRELVWQIQELNKLQPTWKIIGYVDCQAPENGIGVTVGNDRIPYLGTDDWLLESTEEKNIAICVGNALMREKISKKLMQNPMLMFPNLILKDSHICEDVSMGKGCIVSMGAKISTNVAIGDFVFLNTDSMICHDGIIGDFVTLSPDSKLAGAVKVGNRCEIGMGAKVIQEISIGDDVIIGAGSVVVRDITNKGTAVGVPARMIK